MIDAEDVQPSLPHENSGEEPEGAATKAKEQGRGETQKIFRKRLRSCWQAILIGILIVLLCGVTSILFSWIKNKTAELQHMAEEVTAWKQCQIENNQLKQLLNSTNQNFTLLGGEYGQLELFINTTLYNLTLLSAEKRQLSLLLKNTLQEKTQLKVKNKELNMFLNSTLENCNVVQEENRQLNQLLNESLHTLSMTSAESKQLRRQLYNERQSSRQLEAENQHQRSILFSKKLSFLWRFCNKSTLQCLRCPPDWTEHATRCFFMSKEAKKWEDARRQCHEFGADLAVVLNAEDQAFLTNMTFQFRQQHPQENFHSAWIGLRDMVREGTFSWINGNRIQSDVAYWKILEPNNAMASWDKDRAGQDCVAIVPPIQIGQDQWLNSWDDIVCGGERHYLCETMALSLS